MLYASACLPSKLHFMHNIQNFGDELSPYLLERITGTQFSYAESLEDGKLVAVGSLLTWDIMHSKSVVWGSGTLTTNSLARYPRPFPLNRALPVIIKRFLNQAPVQANILAVRGPRTRELIVRTGISCPEVYGDPAILLPRYYLPKQFEAASVGLILHRSQEHLFDKKCLLDKGVRFISMTRAGQIGIENCIDEICSCSKIFTSSLHGLIVAQAYGIPAQWIRLQNNRIHRDECHKFEDYFLGTGQEVQTAIMLRDIKDVQNLMKCKVQQTSLSSHYADKLLDCLVS